jgi:hypothetical protein
MEDKKEIEKWTGFHANKLPHMGNRSTNRVEGSHANIKLHNKTSSGKLELVTTKITEWWGIRVCFYLLLSTCFINVLDNLNFNFSG